jgi:hypothetical protein
MTVKEMYETIGKLRALAEHPATSEIEADNARTRMGELEEKIRVVQERLEENRKKASERARQRAAAVKAKKDRPVKLRRALSNMRKKGRPKPVPVFRQEWPLGWDKRDKVVVDEMVSTNGTLILNWKCPSCGENVERVISKRHRARLKAKPTGELEFVNRIREGETNQLCDRCWEKNR